MNRVARGGATTRRFCGAARVLPVLCVFALLACTGPSTLVEGQPTPTATERETTQFRIAERQSAWTAQRGSLALIRRVIPGEQQQMIALANNTATAGDNFLFLVAYGEPEVVPRAPRLETVLERIGGVPAPFSNLNDNGLNERRDALGTYLWQEERVSETTVCVLAFRRLRLQSRILPAGSAAMEVVLRNCVKGSVDEAVAPMRAERLAFAFDVADINGGVRPRVLNPLAAPGR